MEDEAHEFAPGDPVKLKSSDQRMTVYDVGQYTGRIFVVWFDEEGDFFSSDFSAGVLESAL